MKIERKYMAHYLNAAFGSGDASYTRLGSDLEEYSPELTANVEKKSNIVGETTVTINGYQKQGEVSPYYAEPGDPLFERLQAIIDGDLVLDDLKTDIVEVKLWDKDTAGAYPAVREECYIEVVSYGGDTTGYQIPFNVHYTGVKTKGTFDPAAKKFTLFPYTTLFRSGGNPCTGNGGRPALIRRFAPPSVYALKAAFGGCAPTRACERSPSGEGFLEKRGRVCFLKKETAGCGL